jgi:sugar lactone lactonase YvrE
MTSPAVGLLRRKLLKSNSIFGGGCMPRLAGRLVGKRATMLAMGASLMIVSVFTATSISLASESPDPPVYVKSFGPDGTNGTTFELSGSVAVDQSLGAVYVIDIYKGAVYRFTESGAPYPFSGPGSNINGNELTGFHYPEERPVGRTQVAVDPSSHNFYVADGTSVQAFSESGQPAEFTAGPGAGTNTISGNNSWGVAVDPNGTLYIGEHLGGVFGGSGAVNIYSPSGAPLTQLAVEQPDSLAVDTHGTLYVAAGEAASTEEVLKFFPSEYPVTATTTYTAAPSPVNGTSLNVAVDPSNDDVYVVETADDAPFIPTIIRYDESGALVTAFKTSANGIGIGTDQTVYVTRESQVAVFAPPPIIVGPPSIVSTSVSDVSADAATLLAEINPNTFDTTYYFEYGLADCSGGGCIQVPLGGGYVPAGHHAVKVSQRILGLQGATAYHYRVVAENAEGPTLGPDGTFRTQSNGLGFQLPDARAWELVSPPDKHSGLLVGAKWGLIQAAADGSGLAYLSKGSLEVDPDGSRIPEATSVLATRTSSGWDSQDLTMPNTEASPIPNGDRGEYKLLSPKLSRALLQPRSGTLLSPEASERTPYLRENTEPPLYTPLVTGKEGYANVPPGTEFGGDEHEAVSRVTPIAASADLSHVVVRSEVPLAEGADSLALYEWFAGQLEPVSVLPAAEGGEVVSAALGADTGSTRHALSEDGSRVFWLGQSSKSQGLYARDASLDVSARLDVVQSGGSGTGDVKPTFQGASADGTEVFFTDTHQLTEDASPAGADLYRCEIPSGASPPSCSDLTDLSSLGTGSTESAEVKGLVSGLSSDGSRLFFVARGSLDPTPNKQGDSAIPGEPNLYFWQASSGVRFVATLAEEDRPDWGSLRMGGSSPSCPRNPSTAMTAAMPKAANLSRRPSCTKQKPNLSFAFLANRLELGRLAPS